MVKDITNSVLLEHIQALKNDLQSQISRLDKKIDRIDAKVDRGFEEARQHREALQEDVEVTMHAVYAHGKKLARLP